MAQKEGKRLGNKYPSLFLTIIALIIYNFGISQTYNPASHVVTNDAVSPAQATPIDSRSMFFDAANFVYRDFNGTTEVISYLNLSKYRFGHSPIFVHSGGILQPNGTWSGGSTQIWLFKNGTADSNLVRWYSDSSTVSCAGCLLASNNLSDVANASSSRINLGLGSMATLNSTASGDLNGIWPAITVQKFNGQLPAYYLNYLNLTNTPAIPAQLNPTAAGLLTITGTYPNLTFNSRTPGFEETIVANNALSADRTLNTGTWSFRLSGTAALGLPHGTTAQRPSSPTVGDQRYNTDSLNTETWNGSSWVMGGTGGGGGGGGITALTGDVTASGTGSVVATLATVNSNVFGSNTFLKFGVNGKGLVTSAAAVGASDIITALGYTPYNATNPSGYIPLTALSVTNTGVQGNATYNNTTGVFNIPNYGGDTVNSISGLTTLYQHSLKQNQLSGTGYVKFASTTPSYLTPSQVTADLNVFTSSLQGLVPSSGGGTTNFLRADGTWTTPGGGGTVTSVALSMPSIFSVSGSPITGSGTFGVTLATETSYTGFGNWTASSATPTFGKIPYQARANNTANYIDGYDGSGNPAILAPDTLFSQHLGFTGDSLVWLIGDTIKSRLFRDSLAFHHVVNADGSMTLYAASGFADPLTTNGDIIARISGSTTRLPQGSNNTFLGVQSGILGYYAPFSLTTIGASGPSTFSSGILNIPQYPGGGITLTNLSYHGKLNNSDTILQYSIFNVLDWGIKNDSSSDISTALQNLVNMIPSGAAIYFPAGRYRLDHQIVFNKAVRIQGANEAIQAHINPPASASWDPGNTTIFFTSASDTAFVWKKNGNSIRDICIMQARGVTPTTSVGIMGDSSNDVRLYNIGVVGFNRNVHIINGFEYAIQNCVFFGPKDYNLIIEDTAESDAGDMKITDCWFWAGAYNMNSHVFHKSGGGLSLTGCKFNGSTMGGSYKYGYENAFNLSDVDVFITAASIENFDSSAIFMHPSTTFIYATIQGGEISFPRGAGHHQPYIWLKASAPNAGLQYISIQGIVMGGAASDTAIFLDGNRVSNVTIVPGTFNGFKANIINNNTTNPFNTASRSPYYYVLTGQTTTFDFNQSNIATHTITGTDTIYFANGLEREPFTITITQNGAGTGTVFFPNSVNLATGSATITTDIANGNIVVSGYSNYGGANIIISRITRTFSSTAIPYWDNTNGLSQDVANLAYNKSQASLVIGGRTTGINGQVDIATNLSNFTPGLSIGRHLSSSLGAGFIIKKSRGTMSSPTVVSVNDYIANNWLQPYDGTNYLASASFGSYLDSTASTGSVPSSLFLHAGMASDIDPRGSQLIDLNIDHRGRIGLGRNQVADTALLTLGYNGSFGTFNNGANGNIFSVRQATVQNWSTAGTTTQYTGVTFRSPYFSANNAQTYTNASTLYIEGSPNASTNVTITNPWSLYINSGQSLFGGQVTLSAATSSSASLLLTSSSGTNPTSPLSGQLWWNGTNLNFRTGASTIDLLSSSSNIYSSDGTLTGNRTLSGGNFSLTLGTSGSKISNLSAWSTGGMNLTGGQYNATGGSQLLMVASTINNPVSSPGGTVSNFSAYDFQSPTVTSSSTGVTYANPATLRIENAPTMSTNSTASGALYALDVAAGISHFGLGSSNFSLVTDGSVYLNGAAKTNIVGVGIGASTTTQMSIRFDQGVDISSLSGSNTGGMWWNGTNLYFVDGGPVKRDLLNGIHNYMHAITTPSTGGTVNLVINQYNIINPSGTIATLTVNLPSSPNNNDVVYIKYTNVVTTVTYGNGTVVDGITSPGAGQLVVLTYDSGTTSWY